MKQLLRLALLAAVAALVLGAGEANAARTLLADLMARPPAAEGAKPALTPGKLEACLREARDLDKTGIGLDAEISAIEQTSAEAMFLQHLINMQFARLNGADKAAIAEFEQRTHRHEELTQKFKAAYPLYQAHQADYDTKVAAFENTCAGSFSARDLETVKTKLQTK